MSNEATAKWSKDLPAKCGWYYIRHEGQEPVKEGVIVWVGYNRSGVRHEGQFFTADSSFLQRREFLGPVTVEAVTEVGRLREALEELADKAERASLVQDRSVGIIKQACRYIAKEARAALSPKEEGE